MERPSIHKTLEDAKWLTENLPIKLFGEPILTTPCEQISDEEIKDGTAQKWADQMIDFLKAYRQKFEIGRGLAANQIGISKRIVLVWLDSGPEIYINPSILSTEGKAVYPESCISAATLIIGEVERPWKAEFSYTALDGTGHKLQANEMHTRLLLHELDHLDGELCSDKYIPGTIRIKSGDTEEILKPKIQRVK